MSNTFEIIPQLSRLSYVDEIWLFGSRARGDQSSRSDVDIAVICPLATEDEWRNILSIVDHVKTLLNIDCVRFDQLMDADTLRINIQNQHRVLYQKKGHFMDKLVWKDYFESLGNALNRLNDVTTHPDIATIDYLQDAAIQRFEFSIELYWKVLRKFLAYEKIEELTPKSVVSKSYQIGLIDNDTVWLNMLDDRNRTSHVYKQEDALRIFKNIQGYCPVMLSNYEKLKQRFETM